MSVHLTLKYPLKPDRRSLPSRTISLPTRQAGLRAARHCNSGGPASPARLGGRGRIGIFAYLVPPLDPKGKGRSEFQPKADFIFHIQFMKFRYDKITEAINLT